MSRYPDDGSLIELARVQGSLRGLAGQLGVSRVSLTNYLLRRPDLNQAVRVVLTSRARPIELAVPSQGKRDKAAAQHKALPDGSFPINTVKDLRLAIHAYGRAKPEHRAKVRSLIKRRARALGVSHLIPEGWRAGSVQLAADHKSSIHPDLPNKPGTNWVEQEGGLPPFIKRVAKHIMADSGYTEQHAIRAAISQCKKGRLGPKGLAAAAQWEAMKASAHSHSNPQGEAIELATYSSQELAGFYGGKPAGGQTKAKRGAGQAGGGGKKKRTVRTAEGAKRYKTPIGSEIGTARNADAAKVQQNAGAVDRYKKTVGAGDRDAQVKALNNDELGQLSQVAFSFKSSDPNVVALRSSVVGQLRKRGMNPAKYGYLAPGPRSAAAPVRKPVATKAVPTKKPIPKDPKALGPHKSYPGAVRVR